MLPYVLELVFVNASTSPVRKPLLIDTIVDCMVRLSTSLTVAADNSGTGGPFWAKGDALASTERTGALSTAVMLSVVVGIVLLLSVPSLTIHEIVRLVSVPKLVGLSLLET